MSLLANIESSSAGSAPVAYGDVPGLTTGSIAFGGSDKKLIFLANVVYDMTIPSDQGTTFQFAVDGVREGPEVNIFKDSGSVGGGRMGGLSGFTWARDGLVGNHTISLQWRQDSGVAETDTARVNNLQVLEL